MKVITINFDTNEQADLFMETFTDSTDAIKSGAVPNIKNLMEFCNVTSIDTNPDKGIINIS